MQEKKSLSMNEKENLVKNVYKNLKQKKGIYNLSWGKGKSEGSYENYEWHSYYVYKSDDQIWVAICLAEYFEVVYEKEETPFWIEMSNLPSIEFLKKELYKKYKFYAQPDFEKGRLIIPVSIVDMEYPEDAARMVIEIADDTLI